MIKRYGGNVSRKFQARNTALQVRGGRDGAGGVCGVREAEARAACAVAWALRTASASAFASRFARASGEGLSAHL